MKGIGMSVFCVQPLAFLLGFKKITTIAALLESRRYFNLIQHYTQNMLGVGQPKLPLSGKFSAGSNESCMGRLPLMLNAISHLVSLKGFLYATRGEEKREEPKRETKIIIYVGCLLLVVCQKIAFSSEIEKSNWNPAWIISVSRMFECSSEYKVEWIYFGNRFDEYFVANLEVQLFVMKSIKSSFRMDGKTSCWLVLMTIGWGQHVVKSWPHSLLEIKKSTVKVSVMPEWELSNVAVRVIRKLPVGHVVSVGVQRVLPMVLVLNNCFVRECCVCDSHWL